MAAQTTVPELARQQDIGWWARLLRSKAFWLVALPLLWAIVYLPALGARPLRLEEGRRATPAREMLQTGHFALPTLYGDAYLNKPPFYFWVVAATGTVITLGGDLAGPAGEWAVRLPSVLALLGGAYLFLRFARRDLPRDVRAAAALLLLAMPGVLDKGPLGEIESFLSAVVFAAMVTWWWGYEPGKKHTMASWVLTGVLLAIAMLTKGPPAIAQFYVPLLVFLIWQRDVRRLFSLGHLACLVLFIAPIVLWVWRLHVAYPDQFYAMTRNWLHQMGVSQVQALANQGKVGTTGETLERYLKFPLEAVGMFMPWAILAVAAMSRRVWQVGVGGGDGAEPSARAAALRRFLIAAFLASLVFFWLWPSSRPRHMLAVSYPVAVLAAAGMWGLTRGGLGMPYRKMVAEVWCTVALCILLIAGTVLNVFTYAKAPSDRPSEVMRAFAGKLPPRDTVYTMITFASLKSDETEGLYNTQFYFAPRVLALHELSHLPQGMPQTVFLWKRDLQYVTGRDDVAVEVLGEAPLRGTDLTIVAVEMLRP